MFRSDPYVDPGYEYANTIYLLAKWSLGFSDELKKPGAEILPWGQSHTFLNTIHI